jgi:sporulation protein YlmC with PRC-barrel domain
MKAMRDLFGDEVLASGEHVGELDDMYFDGAAGRVADLLLDDEAWSIDYLIVDTAEAAGVRRVLVPLDWVAAIDPGRRTVQVQRTREELRDSPAP